MTSAGEFPSNLLIPMHVAGGLRGAALLDAVEAHLRRFIAYPSPDAVVAHTLWIAHCHAMDAWESTPRMAFLSPEPGSGKTRCLELTEGLVPNPVEAVNVTPAYLFRKVGDEAGLPTILFDEIDTVFGPKAKDNEEIRGMLNAGHRRGAVAGRCVVRGKTIETEEVPAYCGVALAGLGSLPDTILSRSVIIRMRRRSPSEVVEPFRRRLHQHESWTLRDDLAVWGASMVEQLGDAWPDMPEGIVDRDADVWEPLIAIADAAGGEWPGRSRVAAVALVADAKRETPSLGVRLLADLRTVFGDAQLMSTESILEALCSLDEAPWSDLRGKPLDPRRMSRLLGEYQIKSTNVRIGGSTPKGYRRQDLHDAWQRYLTGKEPSEAARAFAGAGLIDMARHLLEENGEQMRFARAPAVIDAMCRSGSHTTSDFTYLLNSAAQRFLVESFRTAESPLKKLARQRTLPDFRQAFGLDLSGPTMLPLVMENGEFKRVTMNESKDSIQLHTYGAIFAITRQALVNDNLAAFSDAAVFWARAQAEEEATHLHALISGTGVGLEDGVALYHADHGNVASSGGAISVETLDAARRAMRAQKNKDGATYANVVPKYLVVGPAKETEAEQLLSTLAPATAANANPFSGKLELLVDPRLTGNSWRLFADPAEHPVLHMASLEGQEGLMLDSRLGFDVDGVEFKARLDIGSAAWDHRGTYMNPGN